jgi:death on curing protein
MPWSTLAATEVWYPVLADILALHAHMMRGLGENPAPLMAGGQEKLDSTIARSQWAAIKANADLAEQAALLTIGIAQAHAFLDNNKRLGYMAGLVFLRENGHPLPAEHTLAFARLITDALERVKTTTDVAGWLREALELA